jgi:DNA-binding MarR family transcriptional regulator
MASGTDTRQDEIFAVVVAIIDRIAFSARNRVHVVEGEKLYSSEVHLLLHIGESEDHRRNVTRIGETFGITKGAVSQTLSRLVRKGLVTKETDNTSKNELTVHLTDKGWRAYRACLAIKQEFAAAHAHLLDGTTDDEKEALLAYLTRLRDHL